MILSAFADEIASELGVQLAVLKRHGITHVDVRDVGGRNVIELDDERAVVLRDALRAHGLSVATIASPIGKEPADADPAGLRRRMVRAAAVAHLLETDLVRVFGFYPPDGDGGDWRESSLRSLRLLASCARDAGVTLLLENEVGTRAGSIEHATDLLASLGDEHVRAAFDPANALRCGEQPYPDGYARLKPWLRQVHVKDLDEKGRVVPAGFGAADWPSLLDALRRDGYDGLVSLEPHLAHAGRGGGFTGPTLFGEAHRALKALVMSNGARPTRVHKGDAMRTTLSPAKYPPPTAEEWSRRGWRSTGWPFLACVDGRVTPPQDAFVPATDEGFLRGDGGFEVLQVYAGRPFELDRHLDRFARTCEAILLDFPRREILADLSALLEEAGAVDCLWRVLVARGGTRLHLLEWVPPEKRRSLPVALRTIRYQPTVVLSNLKPMSYGANMAASRRARLDGADEGLFVHPDGTVLEAPTASVFWAVDGVLKTPALELGILPSITRVVIMEALETVEVSADLDEVLAADEVFLASTSREIQPVSRLDDSVFEAPGPLCRAARRALDEAVARDARSEGEKR